jgi:branched-subunit amino acid transport protein
MVIQNKVGTQDTAGKLDRVFDDAHLRPYSVSKSATWYRIQNGCARGTDGRTYLTFCLSCSYAPLATRLASMHFRRPLLLNRLWRRLTWPGVTLMMLLQRSPVIPMVAELQLSLGPRLVHLLKWVTPAFITSSIYNSVTGATGDLSVSPSPGSVVGFVNESMSIAIQAEDAFIVSVSLEGNLPPGISSNVGEDGRVTFGRAAFSGIPTQTGLYPMTLTVLSWEEDSTYEGDPIFINFTFNITEEGPEITKAPQSIVVPEGTTAMFSVEVANEEGTTYQWQKNVGISLTQFANIADATASTYSVSNVTAASQGAFRVQVSKNSQTETTAAVFLTVRAADYNTWKLLAFDDTVGLETGPMENPDDDSLINAFEFLFDLDPEVPDTLQIPEVSRERIGTTDYAVFRFPALIDYPDLNFVFESTSDLQNGLWSNLENGVNGAVIEEFPDATILKIPYADNVFCRVKVEVE